MNRTDVDKIYNAGDPDREGQRLVDEIIHYGLKKPKPIYRLWLPDTTNKTVKQAFETAKTNDGYADFPPPQRPAARWTGSWELN